MHPKKTIHDDSIRSRNGRVRKQDYFTISHPHCFVRCSAGRKQGNRGCEIKKKTNSAPARTAAAPILTVRGPDALRTCRPTI